MPIKKKTVRRKPKNQKVTLHADISKTENLGDFNSRKINLSVGFERSVSDDEELSEAFDKVYDTIIRQLRNKYARLSVDARVILSEKKAPVRRGA